MAGLAEASEHSTGSASGTAHRTCDEEPDDDDDDEERTDSKKELTPDARAGVVDMVDAQPRKLVAEIVAIAGVDGDEGGAWLVSLVRSLARGDVGDDSIVLYLDGLRAARARFPDDTRLGVDEILELAPAVDLIPGRTGVHQGEEDDQNPDDDHPTEQASAHSIGGAPGGDSLEFSGLDRSVVFDCLTC